MVSFLVKKYEAITCVIASKNKKGLTSVILAPNRLLKWFGIYYINVRGVKSQLYLHIIYE